MPAAKSLYAAAVRFYTEAFAGRAPAGRRPAGQHRYNAACAAALAGCGQGKDAGGLPDKDHARLRTQALKWLRADLAAWRTVLEKEADKARPAVVQQMQHWLSDTDFTGVRGPEALAQAPRGRAQGLAETVGRRRGHAGQGPGKIRLPNRSRA